MNLLAWWLRREGWLARFVVLAVGSLAAVFAVAASATASAYTRASVASSPIVFPYTGHATSVTVPAGITGACMVADGGDGAGVTDPPANDNGGGGGAVVSGCMAVSPGQVLEVSPGGRGHMNGVLGDTNSDGGWGALGATGGNGGNPYGGLGFASGGAGAPPPSSSPARPFSSRVGVAAWAEVKATLALVDGGSAGPVAQNGSPPSDNGYTEGGIGGAQSGSAGGDGQPGDTSQVAFYSYGGGGGGGGNGGGGGLGSQAIVNGGGPGSGSGGGAGTSALDTKLFHGTLQEGVPTENSNGSVTLVWSSQLTYELDTSASTVTAGGSVTLSLTSITSDGQRYPISLPDPGLVLHALVSPAPGNTGDKPDAISGDQVTMFQAGRHLVSVVLNQRLVAYAWVTVTPAHVDHYTLSAASSQVTAGGSTSFTVTGYDEYGNSTGDATGQATLTSDVASDVVSGNDVRFVKAGAHEITATIGELTATTTVQVVPGAAATATLQTLTGETTIRAGGFLGFTVTTADAYGNQIPGTPAFDLSSSNFEDNVAGHTINFTAAGQRTITADLTGTNLTASLVITVTPGPLTYLVPQPPTATVTPGSSITFTEVLGEDAFDNNLGPVDLSNVVFSSDFASDTITGNKVTLMTPGVHHITARLSSDVGVSGESIITVTTGVGEGGLDPTSTSLACRPRVVMTGRATWCTATVADTASSGPSTPTGTVSFTASPGTAAFGNSGSCDLQPSGRSGVASCSLTFTPSARGHYTVTVSYAGDSAHQASQGKALVRATRDRLWHRS